METNLKFGIKKCLNYISTIEDFTVEFEGKLCYMEQSQSHGYISEPVSVKSYLKQFVMECRKQSLQDDYDFVEWLKVRNRHWRNQHYRIIGSLTDRLGRSQGDEKAEVERKLTRYGSFFNHNYHLIDMVQKDVLNKLDCLADADHPFSDNNHVMLQDAIISSFEKLFKEDRPSEPYFQMLRDHEHPLIGNEHNYVSKALKGGFCLWIYELQRQHIIEHQSDKVYASLLLKKITGLKSFSYTAFGKTNNKAEILYKDYFMTKIAEVKHAQDSQLSLLRKLRK